MRSHDDEPLSNSTVAKLVGVHPLTLERWLSSGKLRWPKVVVAGGRIVRLWEPPDVERLRTFKARHYKHIRAECARRKTRQRETAATPN
jgi:predicted site-specific integrase-resolvase